MFRKVLQIFILVLGLVMFNAQALAQGCVNCRTQIESSQQNELTVGNGINAGITILMISPYILLAVAFYFIFGKRVKYFFKDLIGLWKK
ncbi:hypothetical protein [Parvicella tangerina]|uniref:Uncharacterized protein n=1 Tax=Parvicella tangerina TaxID=2829795 RepID=A0A916JK45_9FLAO|nr:hypothetical protein [Parvicella tangerina]CAG5077853.1 hypothetical protein CRYO30217_00499 [Parvicella tangerina]